MTLKKMFCTIIAAAAMTVFSGAAVYADAISEPDNAFYRTTKTANISTGEALMFWRTATF